VVVPVVKKRKGKKDLKLLSFGEEAEVEDHTGTVMPL
jgi:hypothetical protein